VPTFRPAWNGYLKLSFVSCPIALYPATSAAERLSFRQVNRRTGHRLKHKLVDSVTGEDVPSSDKARGYETAANEYLLVEDHDIARARSERAPPEEIAMRSAPFRRDSPPTAPKKLHRLEEHQGDAGCEDEEGELTPAPRTQNTRVIEIKQFIPAGQVDGAYFDKPYYIAPRGEISQEAFAVIRDAIARLQVFGLARIVLSSRERPVLLQACGRGLRGITLRFAQDLRPEREFFESIPSIELPAEMQKLAESIIKSKLEEFSPAMLEDHYRAALKRILNNKQSRRPAAAIASSPSPENVVHLMDALRRSITTENAGKRPASKRGGTPRRRTLQPSRTKRATNKA
jgi:DNA end-binding protein Ku